MKDAQAYPLRRVLVRVAGNPRTSHRPAEAVRVAAGLAASRRLHVSLCLEGAATGLIDWTQLADWIDGEWIEKGLPLLAKTGGEIFVMGSDVQPTRVTGGRFAVQRIDRRELSDLESSSHATLRF